MRDANIMNHYSWAFITGGDNLMENTNIMNHYSWAFITGGDNLMKDATS